MMNEAGSIPSQTPGEPDGTLDAAPPITPPMTNPIRAHLRISRVDFLLLLMCLIWGVNFSIIKVALEDFHPLSFNAIRFTLASAVLALVARPRASRRKPNRKDLVRLMALGVLANCIYQLFFIHGINLTRAGNAALILGATPVFTTLLSAWRGHERLGRRAILGVAASFLGVSLIVLGSHNSISFAGTFLGDLLIFSCTLLWPIYSVGLRPLSVKYGSMECTRITMIAGTIPLVLLAIPSLLSQSWDRVHVAAWGGLVFSGAGAIAVCYSIWNYGVRRLGNTHTAAYSNITPVISLLVAWVVLGERPLWGQVLGMAIIFAGIYLTRLDQMTEVPTGTGV